MKKLNTAVTALALGVGVLAATAPQGAFAHGKNKNAQNVTVNVTSSGYSPSTIAVKAGRPVHLTFVGKGNSCANEVSIPALKKSFSVQPGQKKEVVFTPKKGQTVAFACSMKMFKGKVTAK